MANYQLTRADAQGNVRAAGGSPTLADAQQLLLKALAREIEWLTVVNRQTVCIEARPFRAEVSIGGAVAARYDIKTPPVYEVIPDVVPA